MRGLFLLDVAGELFGLVVCYERIDFDGSCGRVAIFVRELLRLSVGFYY